MKGVNKRRVTVETTVENFISKYGVDRLRELVRMLSDGTSGQKIADHLNVSRERVRQWKNLFGDVMIYYKLHPEVAKHLRED